MKKIHFFTIIILVVIVIISANCTKEEPVSSTSSGSGTGSGIINPPPPPINTPPIANAGSDTNLFVPVNFCDLIGSGFDREDNILTFQWKKISGPVSFFIQNPTFKSTKLTSLEKGVYQFELTVTDRPGLSAKDTVKVTVHGLPDSTHEVILDNLVWIFPWYNAVEIKNVHNYITAGSPFRIFINRDNSPGWIEVNLITDVASTNSYEYFIETRWPDGAGMYSYGSLYIFYYGTDVSDTPKVKIVF